MHNVFDVTPYPIKIKIIKVYTVPEPFGINRNGEGCLNYSKLRRVAHSLINIIVASIIFDNGFLPTYLNPKPHGIYTREVYIFFRNVTD